MICSNYKYLFPEIPYRILKYRIFRKLHYPFINTSPASHFVPLQASPAGLLGRFASSHLALRAHENFQKSVSKSIQNGLKRIEMQKKKNVYPFDS